MIIDFAELNQHFFSISDIFAVKQIGMGKTRFIMQEPRHTDALLLFAKTTGICYQSGFEPLYIPRGALVYMPKGSKYIWENSPACDGINLENLLFEFTLKDIDVLRNGGEKNEIVISQKQGERIAFSDRVCIVSTNYFELYEQMMNLLAAAFENCSALLQIYTQAYDFFNTLSNNCQIEQKNNSDISLIKNSIKYLEESSSSKKSIKQIADFCNISIGYYEKLFRNYAGISPVEYRNMYRINRIKMYLQNPNMTLAEIAEKIGYCDSGYLCRIFKQKTGIKPKEYRRIYIAQTQKNLLDKTSL